MTSIPHFAWASSGGLEYLPSTVISGLWSVQISKPFLWMYSSTSLLWLPCQTENIGLLVKLAYGSHSVQVCTGYLLASVPRQFQYLLERPVNTCGYFAFRAALLSVTFLDYQAFTDAPTFRTCNSSEGLLHSNVSIMPGITKNSALNDVCVSGTQMLNMHFLLSRLR